MEFAAVARRMKHVLSSRDFVSEDGSLIKDVPDLACRAKRIRDMSAHLKVCRPAAADFNVWIDIPKNVRPLFLGGGKYRPQDAGAVPISFVIKGLAPHIDGGDVRNLFADYGAVRDVYIPFCHERSALANYCFVELVDGTYPPQQIYIGDAACNIQLARHGRRSSDEMKRRAAA
jgi:hypothetical protein